MPVMSAGIRSGVNWIAAEGAVDDVGERAHEHRLAQARDALEQHVAVGEQPDQRLPDQLPLADDDLADLGLDGAGALGERLGREAVRLGGAAFGRGGCVHGSSGCGPSPAGAVTGSGSSELK